MFCNTQFLLNTALCIKKEVFFSFHIVCPFLKLETSLNYATFEYQDFVKTQNFESNDVIVTSYHYLQDGNFIKPDMNCELSIVLIAKTLLVGVL